MPSPSEWEDRKSQILALIADDDLNTVLGKMKDQGFTASKAQYEQQFVKWNARKNLKKGEWREAIAVYDSLVTQHGERNVRLLISDIPVPKTRILQNRRRYCRGGPQTMDLATESEDMAGHLPRGVSFRVLRAHGEWISPPPDELRIERSFTTGNPPVSSRSIFPASLRGAGALEDIPDAAIPDPSSSPAFPVFTAWEDRENPAMPSTAAFDPIALLSLVDQRPVSSSPFHFSPGQFDFNSAIWSESVPVDNSQKTPAQILSDLGFCQFEKRVLEGTGTTSLHTWLAGHTHFLQSPTTQFLSCITVPQQSSFDLLNTQLAEHHYLHSLLQPFMSLLPGEDLSFAQNVANFDAHIHRLLLFSFANGFPGLEMVDLTRVLGFLSQYRNIGSLLMQLKGIPGPYSKAIAVGLFKLCVESGEAQVAQQLLDAKRLNVNAIIFTQNGIRLTPLERASQLQNADMVRVLLANGADANKSFEPFKGPISRLLRGIKTGTTINPVAQRAVSQLLDAGARVESSDLKHVLKSLHDNEVAFELALSLLDRDPDAWLSDGLLLAAARELDEKQMSQILNTVLPRYEICKGEYSDYPRSQIHRALIACAEKGHSQLVERLLPHYGYPVTEVLSGAIRGRHKDLAEWIASEYGPSLNAESHTHTVNGYDHPLIDAIWTKDADLIRFCEETDSLSRLRDCHFRRAMDAAASTGNLKYVCRLLKQFRHPEPGELYEPLLHAIQADQKHISVMLLEAGADVNSTSDENLPDPFMAAIIRGNRSLVHAIMDANFDGCPGFCKAGDCPCYEVDGEETTILSALIRLGDQSLITKAIHMIPSHLRLQESDVEDIVAKRQHGMFRFLLDQKAFRHTAVTARLTVAAASNDWTMVREMLDLGANPGNIGALISAADTSQEMFQFLFEKVTRSLVPFLDDRQSSGEYGWGTIEVRLLQHIIEKGVSGLPILAFIIKSGKFDLNCQPTWPLLTPLGAAIEACSVGRGHGLEAVKILLEAGCDPNATINGRGYVFNRGASTDSNLTPLLLAIQLKRTDLVTLLLEKHAQVNKEATLGIERTPLQKAAELGCLEIVKQLLSHGADVNAAPAYRGGGTALQLAAISGNCNIACILFEHGADLHQPPSILGRWPLEGAAEQGRLEMIEYLWRASNGKGFSDEIYDRAIELAGGNGHEACQDLIRDLRKSKDPSTDLSHPGAVGSATRPVEDGKLRKEISRRISRKNSLEHSDYFEQLLAANEAVREGDRRMKHMLTVTAQLIIGGHDPTSFTIYMMFYFLIRSPEALERLQQEIRESFLSYKDTDDEKLRGLPWLNACLSETLRLANVATHHSLPRLSPGAVVIGGYIPKGHPLAQVLCRTAMFAYSRSARFFHKPKDFRPERWLPRDHPNYNAAFAKDDHGAPYQFSIGPRQCPGREVARIMLNLVVAKMLWWFEVEQISKQLDFDTDFRV
ncbi:hypothetical protein PG989_013583 [Apiospora arundinis]